jgi:hypothetical protein
LRDCCQADNPDDVKRSHLSCVNARNEISSNTFYINTLPIHLKSKLDARQPHRTITPDSGYASSSDEAGDCPKEEVNTELIETSHQ